MKPINVDPKDVGLHDSDSSELSASTASNSTLPQLEATDAKKAQNEGERRRRRRVARKEKSKAREKKKERREARKKKEQEAKASNASSSELSSSSEDGDDDESYQVHSKTDKKGKGKKNVTEPTNL